MIGILCENSFDSISSSIHLREPAARAKGLATKELELLSKEIVQRCRKENRKLVAYSQHELDCLRDYTSFGQEIKEVYVNAIRPRKAGTGANSVSACEDHYPISQPSLAFQNDRYI